jgi:hypothetical protein
MPVARCSGEGCARQISVSLVPGGNPVARQTGMCVEYGCCEACGRFWCDACGPAGTACPRCGTARVAPDPRHALAVMSGAWTANVDATVALRRPQ